MAAWVRVGRSNARNLYLSSGSTDWKNDTPIGSMYEPDVGRLVARALNYYLDAHPLEAPRHPRDTSMDAARRRATQGCDHPIEYRRLGIHPEVTGRFANQIDPDTVYCLRCERPVDSGR
jgi:hypothetical protein